MPSIHYSACIHTGDIPFIIHLHNQEVVAGFELVLGEEIAELVAAEDLTGACTKYPGPPRHALF